MYKSICSHKMFTFAQYKLTIDREGLLMNNLEVYQTIIKLNNKNLYPRRLFLFLIK
jgi:hypothetical protein